MSTRLQILQITKRTNDPINRCQLTQRMPALQRLTCQRFASERYYEDDVLCGNREVSWSSQSGGETSWASMMSTIIIVTNTHDKITMNISGGGTSRTSTGSFQWTCSWQGLQYQVQQHHRYHQIFHHHHHEEHHRHHHHHPMFHFNVHQRGDSIRGSDLGTNNRPV